jgi:hypothetical protein
MAFSPICGYMYAAGNLIQHCLKKLNLEKGRKKSLRAYPPSIARNAAFAKLVVPGEYIGRVRTKK